MYVIFYDYRLLYLYTQIVLIIDNCPPEGNNRINFGSVAWHLLQICSACKHLLKLTQHLHLCIGALTKLHMPESMLVGKERSSHVHLSLCLL